MACVLLYNMIIHIKINLGLEFSYDNIGSRLKPHSNSNRIQAFLEAYRRIEVRASHTQIRDDLIEHNSNYLGDMLPFYSCLFTFIHV
jgi:hypothetical protein